MKIKEFKEYNLYYEKSNKFRNTLFRFVFRTNINEINNVYTSLLFDILTYSSKNYDTERKITLKKQDLYNLSIFASQDRIGNHLVNTIDLDLINPDLTDNTMLHESIMFLKELLFNPNVIDNHFDSKIFNIMKTKMRNDIMSIKEDKQYYSYVKLLQNSNLNYPLNISLYNSLNILDDLDEYKLYDYYKNYFNENKLDIFVITNISENEIIKELKYLEFKENNIKLEDNKIIYNKQDVIFNKELINEPQSKISRLYKLEDYSEFEYKYVSNIYGNILGGLSNSLLMKNVREKNSLCYYVSSAIQKMDDMMIITSGFDKKNYTKLIKNIDENIDFMKKGEFDKKLIKDSVECMINAIKNSYNKIYGIMNFNILIYLYKVDNVKERINNYKKVSYEDIISYANKVTLYSEYYLEGDINE